MRVKIVKKHRQYKQGDIVDVSKNEAFGLLDSGTGILTKDMLESDYKVTKSDEEQADVRTKLPRVRK